MVNRKKKIKIKEQKNEEELHKEFKEYETKMRPYEAS